VYFSFIGSPAKLCQAAENATSIGHGCGAEPSLRLHGHQFATTGTSLLPSARVLEPHDVRDQSGVSDQEQLRYFPKNFYLKIGAAFLVNMLMSYQVTMVGNNGERTKCVKANQNSANAIPTAVPTRTCFQEW
jgi:hypothetical protein